MSEERAPSSPLLVRGISLISTLEYLRNRLGEEGLKELIDNLPDNACEVLLAVKKGDWYPFSLQRLLREEIARRFNPSNPRQAILEAYLSTSEYEISSFLQGILTFMSVPLVLRQAASLWGKYYNQGKMRAISLAQNRVALELSNFPSDYLFCPTLDAWLTVAAGFLNLKNPMVKETACIHRGDPCCRWEVSWDKE